MDLRVVVVGAGGKMGREVVKAVHAAPDMELVGAVDPGFSGTDAGVLAGLGPLGIETAAGLEEAIGSTRPTRSSTSRARYRLRQRARCGGEGARGCGHHRPGRDEWDHIDQLARERVSA